MISNENFFAPFIEVVDMLKIKGSYGVVGNDKICGDWRFIYDAKFEDVNSYVLGLRGPFYFS